MSTLKDLNEETLISFLHVDVDNDYESDISARYNDISIPMKVRRIITTNCKDFESFIQDCNRSRLPPATRGGASLR
jgi:hypothetical protein